MKLHRSYSTWWAVLIPSALLSDLLGWPVVTAVALVLAGIVEVVALHRRKLGDTLSEHVWKLIENRPAVVPPALGFSVWLVWTSLKLIPASADFAAGVEWPVGVLAFGVGVLGWLIPHFAFRGKYG